jgi:hypothetical protein
MASRCASVIRGGKKPLVVLVTSNAAEATGVVVPMPTWAKRPDDARTIAKNKIRFFINNLSLTVKGEIIWKLTTGHVINKGLNT